MGPKVRIHCFVKGMVQDGSFSQAVQHAAVHLGVNGIIKHLPDRRMEIIAEGEKHILEEFLEELRYGEIASHITDIQTTWEEATKEFIGLLVR